MVTVSPHMFRPLRRWWNQGRCLHCYMHEVDHPVPHWAPARPLYDRTAAVRLAVPGGG